GLRQDDGGKNQRIEELGLRLGPPLPLKGKASWRGKADASVKVIIKGKDVAYSEGTASGSLGDGLPDVPYSIKRVKKTAGDAAVRIVEQPSPTNGYAAVVLVDPKKRGADTGFEVEWELKRQGHMAWSGKVSGRSLIRLQGPYVDIDPAEAAKEVKFQFEGIPHQ